MVAIAVPVNTDLIKLRHEFLALPGLSLTVPQAARLLSIDEADARQLLKALVEERLLLQRVNGTYGRSGPLSPLDKP